MWKFIIENWQIIVSTAAIILGVVSMVVELLIRSRLKKVCKVDKELIDEKEKAEEKAKKFSSYAEIFLCVPSIIKEAEEVFRTEKSGSLKLGYVLQRIQKMFDDAHIKASSSELTDYIESILATPEKKGE